VNVWVAAVFGGILVLVGLLGFVVPPDKARTSGAPPYNLFHIAFGLLGLVCAAAGTTASRAFNVGFGVLDLYQLAASRRGWFPQRWFRWKPADDALHLVIGVALIAVGLFGG
jgi:hypothetical protein